MATQYKKSVVEGLNIAYREAGPKDAPAIVLLHGFPSSSHMFRDLIADLEGRFHLIAPDYPGFGNSDMPAPAEFAYNFDHLASVTNSLLEQLGIGKYSLYMQDYGGPVGFRLAARHPERIESLIIQNANIYMEGLSEAMNPIAQFWQDRPGMEAAIRGMLTRQTTEFQYTHGAKDASKISPDAIHSDQAFLDRPGNDAIQLELLFQYQHNVPLFAEWQEYLRKNQPPVLVAWGRNDPFFTVAGAEAYRKDVQNVDFHILDGGHFLLEEAHEEVAELMAKFLTGLKA